MSISLSTQVWKTFAIPATQKIVLLCLADHANAHAECWPSVETLARRCGMARRSVMRHLADLEKQCFIQRRNRSGRSTLYAIDERALIRQQTSDITAQTTSVPDCHPAPAQTVTPPVPVCHGGGATLSPITIKETLKETLTNQPQAGVCVRVLQEDGFKQQIATHSRQPASTVRETPAPPHGSQRVAQRVAQGVAKRVAHAAQGAASPTATRHARPARQTGRAMPDTAAPAPPTVRLPDWMPLPQWQAFVAERQKGLPLSIYATEIAVRQLGRLRQSGHSPAEVLEQSVLNGWKGLFPIRGSSNEPNHSGAFAEPYAMKDYGESGPL